MGEMKTECNNHVRFCGYFLYIHVINACSTTTIVNSVDRRLCEAFGVVVNGISISYMPIFLYAVKRVHMTVLLCGSHLCNSQLNPRQWGNAMGRGMCPDNRP